MATHKLSQQFKSGRNFSLKTMTFIALLTGVITTAFAGKAMDQLKDAQHQSGRTTFDGAKRKANPVKGKTTKRTQQQAIKEYKNSNKTTQRERDAIKRYKESGKSRSGK